MSKPFSIVAKGRTAEIVIYDNIDMKVGVSAKAVSDGLKAAGNVNEILVRINSPGGVAFEAMAIYEILRSHKARVVTQVDGAALSAATIVLMAGNEIRAAKHSMLMIHDPISLAGIGTADDLRATASLLDRLAAQLVTIYAERSKQPPETIASWMVEERWFTADEAKSAGLVDVVTAGMAVAASFDLSQLSKFRNVPSTLLSADKTPVVGDSEMSTNATFQELKALCGAGEEKFIFKMLDADATLADATQQWIVELKARASKPAKPGADPVAFGRRPGQAATPFNASRAPVAEGSFEELVDEAMSKGKSRHDAVRHVARKCPAAHKQFLLDSNPPSVHSKIEDRFAGIA